MTERFDYSKAEIDMSQFPGLTNDTSFSDVARHFIDLLPGKILTTHYQTPGNEEDVVTAVPIEMAAVLSDGTVSIITPDVNLQPSALQVDGKRTPFIWSIYEENDLWFQDPENDKIWYGIYDTALTLGYIVRAEDESN